MSGLNANRVVVPVDFSESSTQSVDLALSIAGDPSKVHLIHVLMPLIPTEPGVIWNAIDDTTRTRNVLDSLRNHFDRPEHDGLKMHVEFGDPGRKIASFAESIDADLIVMPSHGRTGLPRLLLGSVAERVTRLAECPVLLLRGRKVFSAADESAH